MGCRTSTQDAQRSGRPKSVTTEEVVQNVRQLKLMEVVEIAGLSKERTHQILTGILGLRKSSARWVLPLLTPNKKI